mmetsp:Transcript_6362/g.14972  ORF Transcript_6362/g.14972 Transcript_6362/m.14972 type:complete len:253 (+) Transcript_6362:333-1091(+)
MKLPNGLRRSRVMSENGFSHTRHHAFGFSPGSHLTHHWYRVACVVASVAGMASFTAATHSVPKSSSRSISSSISTCSAVLGRGPGSSAAPRAVSVVVVGRRPVGVAMAGSVASSSMSSSSCCMASETAVGTVVATMSAGAGVNPRTGCWSSALDDTCRQATWHAGGDSGAVRHATRCGSSPSANRTRRAVPRGPSQGGLEGHRRSQRADQTEHGPQHVGLHVHACEVRGSSIDATGPTDVVHQASALVLTTG